MKKSLKKGFTLVELVIVIAVIAILSAVLIPTFGNVIENSKATSAYENAKNAMTSYSVNNEGATVGDGWIVVFDTAVAYNKDTKYDGTTGNTLPTNAYVFQLKDGSLIQKQGKETLKGKLPDSVKFAMSELNIDADGWTATEGVTLTAIPLNYKFTTSSSASDATYDGVTATVWWFANVA